MQFHGHILLVIFAVKKLFEYFMKKNYEILKNTNQQEFRIEKVSKKTG